MWYRNNAQPDKLEFICLQINRVRMKNIVISLFYFEKI